MLITSYPQYIVIEYYKKPFLQVAHFFSIPSPICKNCKFWVNAIFQLIDFTKNKNR